MYPAGDVTQWFAQNPALYDRMDLDGHNGIDLVRPHGEPLYAVEDGIVLDVKNDPSGYGKHIRFISKKKYDNHYREWVYAHNSKNYVEVGEEIAEGQHIADMGNTGYVVSGSSPYWHNNPYAGTHLHIGMRKTQRRKDGWSYDGSDIKIKTLNYGNGYKGSVDCRNILEQTTQPKQAGVDELRLTLIGLLRRYVRLLQKRL